MTACDAFFRFSKLKLKIPLDEKNLSAQKELLLAF